MPEQRLFLLFAFDVVLVLLHLFLVFLLYTLSHHVKGANIKYVGRGAGGFYKFFKKYFVAHETIDLNISWLSNFLRKYFMVPPINFSSLFKAYL